MKGCVADKPCGQFGVGLRFGTEGVILWCCMGITEQLDDAAVAVIHQLTFHQQADITALLAVDEHGTR